jgi:Mg2+ and Co2+ transporter CorA
LKKKTSKKKATKKKAGKKKRSKKKTASTASSSESLSRLMAAVDELREAVVGFAQTKSEDQQAAVAELRRSAQAKIADLEDSAVRALKRLRR